MPYLNNNKFKEIRTAATDGNEKALQILQALRKGKQGDVDRLIQDYYAVPSDDSTQVEVSKPENIVVEQPAIAKEPIQIENSREIKENKPEIEDLTDILDKETDGLFDENEIDPMDFAKYLENKHRDQNRSKKTADYFKAFDPNGRANYISAKKDAYKAKFGDSLHDIERQFSDYDKSIDKYSQNIGDLLDDDKEMDVNIMGDAYNDITSNNGIMHSFGRYWDDTDTEHIVDDLKELVSKYGKKNVLAALNILKTDNSNFRDYRLGQINEEVDRYNKSLDKILK